MTLSTLMQKFSDQPESKAMESSINPPRIFHQTLTEEEEKEIFELPQEILDQL